MALRLDGKALAAQLERELEARVRAGLGQAGRPPGLAVIRVGHDPASAVYVANKERACGRVGIRSFATHQPADTDQQTLLKTIQQLNRNPAVDGILLQLPLPRGLDGRALLLAIDPDKDVDGLHPLNLGRLLRAEQGPRSCTPAGVMALLQRAGIALEGKRALVVGRSILVGQPMALMLQQANATVTVAHSCTVDLLARCREAELLVVAAGRPGLLGAEAISPGTVVVDVGIHRQPAQREGDRGRLCGDVRAGEVETLASHLTPVPGGVGPMTVMMLLVNTVRCWARSHALDPVLPELH
ncbi:MAG: bifunctional methylenetetrahydrofolate dehydrogenase/methenyltetrahydrofolate cyclohydrolase FolD [Aphanocapsa feldmannii 288cV]|nr:MAG: bifunctional methylenetetrahydrofolate dehydrogenase/methenyltetrahydrofolate cyclohydrolase FolD [Aphanocapsa feldmannii 288cV]